MYPDGQFGSRTDSGKVFTKNKMDVDEDITEFFEKLV